MALQDLIKFLNDGGDVTSSLVSLKILIPLGRHLRWNKHFCRKKKNGQALITRKTA